jgi:hypothetical protein
MAQSVDPIMWRDYQQQIEPEILHKQGETARARERLTARSRQPGRLLLLDSPFDRAFPPEA